MLDGVCPSHRNGWGNVVYRKKIMAKIELQSLNKCERDLLCRIQESRVRYWRNRENSSVANFVKRASLEDVLRRDYAQSAVLDYRQGNLRKIDTYTG